MLKNEIKNRNELKKQKNNPSQFVKPVTRVMRLR